MAVVNDCQKGQKQALAERREAAFQLRVNGLSYRQIGQRLGISEATSHKYVQQVMEKLEAQTLALAEKYRALELQRLDRLWVGSFQAALEGDQAAVNACLKISESRRKLLGLDSPVQAEVAIAAAVCEIPSPLTAIQYQVLTSGNGNGSNAANN